ADRLDRRSVERTLVRNRLDGGAAHEQGPQQPKGKECHSRDLRLLVLLRGAQTICGRVHGDNILLVVAWQTAVYAVTDFVVTTEARLARCARGLRISLDGRWHRTAALGSLEHCHHERIHRRGNAVLEAVADDDPV